MKKTHYIIEGVDSVGKDTLINNIVKKLGYHMQVHYSKPIDSEFYPGERTARLKEYQSASFNTGFVLLTEFKDISIVFNRFHLGEYVYSDRYRDYSGMYVFELEDIFDIGSEDHIKLILLKTSDWSFIKDDGENHDYSQRFSEQEDFEWAFNHSKIKNKVMIDIMKEPGIRKSEEDVLLEALGEIDG